MLTRLQISLRCWKVIVVVAALGGIGGGSSTAWAQSSNPQVASLIAAIKTSNGPLSPGVLASFQSLLSSQSSGNISSFISSVFSTGGAVGGASGVSISAQLSQAVAAVAPNLPAASQTAVGQGIGQAAVVLAANGFSGSTTSALASLPPSVAGGVQTGMAQTLAALPATMPNGTSPAAAITQAASGTGMSGTTTQAITLAPTLSPPQVPPLNPNQLLPPCGTTGTGSCN